MLRNSYFGANALIILGVHVMLFCLDLLVGLPYFRTLFYPMFNMLILMLAFLGAFQKDKTKAPAIIALVLGLAALAFWVVALVIRLGNA